MTSRPRRSRGTAARPAPRGGGLRGALSHHASSLVASLSRLLRAPVATALTIAVVAIAVALPAGLAVLLKNIDYASSSWDTVGQVTVFLEPDEGAARARSVADTLREESDVQSVAIVDPVEGLAVLAAQGDFGDALDALDENPLPWAVILTPEAGVSQAAMEALSEQAEAIDGVAFSQFDMVWLIRFNAMIDAGTRLVQLVSALLVLGVLLIVGNTIRLDIENRREEIEITKMLGGTDGFIRRPFLYTGAWIGAIGGLAAAVLVGAAAALLDQPVSQLAAAYDSQQGLFGLTPTEGAGLVLASGIIGWLGSWVAVARHLAAIQPSRD